MDPNANLDELRKLLARFNVGTLDDLAKDRALELTDALIAWMSSGGAPPDELLEAFESRRDG